MKGQRRTGSFSIISSVLFLFLTWTGPGGAQAQDITVDSADPPSAEQGTVNLDVVIRGSGFKKGDKAKFLVTTANDPGGIKVNSTKVRGSTRIIANIDVASDAQTEKKFDIEIFSNGRSGKGIERFKVTKKGGGTEGQCDLTGATPTDFTLVRTLTLETLREDSRFGNMVRGRQLVDLTVNDKVEPILLAITERAGAETGGPGRVNLYLLEPSGIVSRLVRLVDGKKENVTLETLVRSSTLVLANLDGNDVPDFISASSKLSSVEVFLGSYDPGDETLKYGPGKLVEAPADLADFLGRDIAVGDIDGDSQDEFAVSSFSGGPGKKTRLSCHFSGSSRG